MAHPFRLQAGPIPLYFQLRQHLQERIEAGEFPPGQPLPTEERLCREFGVSRITVRRALDALLASGLISRRRGVGTFVTGPVPPIKSVTLLGSLDDVLAPARDLSQKVLSRGTVEPPRLIVQALQLPPGTRVVRLETVSRSAGEPFAYGEFFFPEAVGGLIRDSDVAGGTPILRAVEHRLGESITRAEQTVEPAVADRTVAAHLGLKPRAPVLRVVRTYYVADERPVEAVVLRFHPERYRYTVQLVATRPTP